MTYPYEHKFTRPTTYHSDQWCLFYGIEDFWRMSLSRTAEGWVLISITGNAVHEDGCLVLLRGVICPPSYSDLRGHLGLRGETVQKTQVPGQEPPLLRVVPGILCGRCPRPNGNLLLPHAGESDRLLFPKKIIGWGFFCFTVLFLIGQDRVCVRWMY